MEHENQKSERKPSHGAIFHKALYSFSVSVSRCGPTVTATRGSMHGILQDRSLSQRLLSLTDSLIHLPSRAPALYGGEVVRGGATNGAVR